MEKRPIKRPPPDAEESGGEVDNHGRAAGYYLTRVYTNPHSFTTPPGYVEEAIDWHAQAYQALRRAYKGYELGFYQDAKAAMFEFYFADQRHSSGFTSLEYNR